MIKVFCEIIQTYKRTTLFSVMTLLVLLMLMISEAFGFMSTSIDFVATAGISIIAVGLFCDALVKSV